MIGRTDKLRKCVEAHLRIRAMCSVVISPVVLRQGYLSR